MRKWLTLPRHRQKLLRRNLPDPLNRLSELLFSWKNEQLLIPKSVSGRARLANIVWSRDKWFVTRVTISAPGHISLNLPRLNDSSATFFLSNRSVILSHQQNFIWYMLRYIISSQNPDIRTSRWYKSAQTHGDNVGRRRILYVENKFLRGMNQLLPVTSWSCVHDHEKTSVLKSAQTFQHSTCFSKSLIF